LVFNSNEFSLFPLCKVHIVLGTCIGPAWRPAALGSLIAACPAWKRERERERSPANRSRSGPNSVYVDMSKGDNVQGILGAIGPLWAKWGLGRVLRSASSLRCGNPEDLSGTSQRPIFTKFGHETQLVSRLGIRKNIFENFHFRGHLPPKSEIIIILFVGQTGTSLRAGYRSRDALQRDTVYSTL